MSISVNEKCKGAMVATAIGDALGWANEPNSKNKSLDKKTDGRFVEWKRDCRVPRWHTEQISAGEYSDDTQLTLAVARSIICGDFEAYFIERELPFWLNYQRGGGGATLRAAGRYGSDRTPLWRSTRQDYFNAGGNGAAMRILPHVIASAESGDLTALMIDIVKDARISHGHPRAILGATCYAYALNYLLKKNEILEYGELVTAVAEGREIWGGVYKNEALCDWLAAVVVNCGYDFVSEWESTLAKMIEKLAFIGTSLKKGLMLDDNAVLTELGCLGNERGAGDLTVLAAVYLASRYANNPRLGIKVAAYSSGADTDTVASITGGLLGMLSGLDWIPAEWLMVQDRECILRIAELLLSKNRIDATRNELAGVQNGEWESSDIGKMQKTGTTKVPNGKNGDVVIEKWKTALGQTLYIKHFEPCAEAQISENVKTEIRLPVAGKMNTGAFTVDSEAIDKILKSAGFKKNITAGKLLKIINDIIKGGKTNKAIAEKYNVDEQMVSLLGLYIK